MNQEELVKVVEALLFSSDQALTPSRLREIIPELNPKSSDDPLVLALPSRGDGLSEGGGTAVNVQSSRLDLPAAIKTLKEKYGQPDSPVVVLEVAEGWQFATNPLYVPWIKRLFKDRMQFKLTQPALETLAIIAYRQPITRAEVEEIRGVEVIAALETLLEKNLIKVAGRKETVGRPLLYASTSEFLRQFGLRSLNDLPKLDANATDSQEVETQESQTNGQKN